VKTFSYQLKEKKKKLIQYYYYNRLDYIRLNYSILHVTLAAQIPMAPLMSNLLGLSSGKYTKDKGFSRGKSQRKKSYYFWKSRKRLDRSDCHSKVNMIRLIGNWGVKERCLLNKMANSVLAIFLMRKENIEVWGVFNRKKKKVKEEKKIQI
jgi:hypothetical protein